MKILVIGEINDVLVHLKAALGKEYPDYKLFISPHGLEGLEWALEKDPDVIFLDETLPDAGGLDVCYRLKTDDRLREIPVVWMIFPIQNHALLDNALKAGVESFLYKPVNEVDFLCLTRSMSKIKQYNSQNQLLDRASKKNQKLEQTIKRIKGETPFQFLADSGLVLIWTSGTDKKCDCFNPSWLHFTGRALMNELGFGWLEGVHNEDVKRFLRVYEEAFDHQQKFSIEIRILHHTGAYRWIQLVGSPRYDDEGAFMGFFSIALDIHERKQAEEAFHESERQQATLISNLPGFAYRCLYDDFWTMKFISDGCKDITGYAPKDFIDNRTLTFNDVIFPEFQEEIRRKWKKVLRQQKAFEHVYPILTKKGTVRWVWERGRGVFSGDVLLYLEGFITDITERKMMEDRLRESEVNLKELNANKDTFFSIIAHDLRSPFNSILGFSNIMLDEIRQNKLEDIEEYAAIIQSSSKKVMELLTNLLEWSRTSKGRMTFIPEYFEMGVLIDEVLELSIDSAEQKSISITKDFSEKMMAFADKTMIGTVLRNLISNAIKFTDRGGHITIKVDQRPKECLVMVSDNGVGMDKENIGKVFRMDESYSTVGTNNESGTGLGLLICKEFIQKHHGRIWVESQPEVGSRFYFTIPKVSIPVVLKK